MLRYSYMIAADYYSDTTLFNLWLRMLGAKIGRNVSINTQELFDPDLVEIGADSVIAEDVAFATHEIECDPRRPWLRRVRFGSVKIGRECLVAHGALLSANSEMSDRSALRELSALPSNTVIPEMSVWRGSPARLTKQFTEANFKRDTVPRRQGLFGLLFQAFGVLLTNIYTAMVPMAVALVWDGMQQIDDMTLLYKSIATVCAVGVALWLFSLVVILAKWLLLGRVSAQRTYHRYDSFYYRKWLVDRLARSFFYSLFLLAVDWTLVSAMHLRLLGGRVALRSSVSLIRTLSPAEADLISAARNAVVGSAVLRCSVERQLNTIQLRPIVLHENCFVADGCVLLGGTTVGANSVIGSLSTVDRKNASAIGENEVWLGSPASNISHPQLARTDVAPSVVLQLVGDLFTLFMSLALFPTLLALAIVPVFVMYYYVVPEYDYWVSLVFMPLVMLLAMVSVSVLVVIVSVVFGNRFVLRRSSFWSMSRFLWQFNRSIIVLHCTFFRAFFGGTFFMELWMKLLGYKIGQECFLDFLCNGGKQLEGRKKKKAERQRNDFLSISPLLQTAHLSLSVISLLSLMPQSTHIISNKARSRWTMSRLATV
jgi:acetyltransferase-like isoleucine patch superfamily enzyme